MTAVALLLSTDAEPLDRYDAALREAGYDVLRCHPDTGSAFPCTGLLEGECPLDADDGVDIVVDVRQHPWPHPTARETGVTCALRSRVPVVVLSDHRHPFEQLGAFSAVADADLAEACDDAIAAALDDMRVAIGAEVELVLARHGCDVPIAVGVERRRGRLRVRIAAASVPKSVAAMAATRAAVVARRLDPRSTALHVELVPSVSVG